VPQLAGGRLVDTSRDDTLFPDSDEVGTKGGLARHLVAELACVASWLDAEAGRSAWSTATVSWSRACHPSSG